MESFLLVGYAFFFLCYANKNCFYTSLLKTATHTLYKKVVFTADICKMREMQDSHPSV